MTVFFVMNLFCQNIAPKSNILQLQKSLRLRLPLRKQMTSPLIVRYWIFGLPDNVLSSERIYQRFDRIKKNFHFSKKTSQCFFVKIYKI